MNPQTTAAANTERARQLLDHTRHLLREAAHNLHRARTLARPLAQAAQMVSTALAAGGKLILFGNGGSAAQAQHIAAEFVGRFQSERRPLPALALTTDTSALTAIGNDYGFQEVFARQLCALARPGDVVLAISTSGRSPNVLRGVETARRLSLVVLGLTGDPGEPLRQKVQLCLCAPGTTTARIQEVHLVLLHTLCALVEDLLGVPTLTAVRRQAGRERKP